MTTISTVEGFIDELRDLLEAKDDPDEWYIVAGNMVGEYSVHAAEKPEGIPDDQSELPSEARDANENVDGFVQIGNAGWSADAFADDSEFVSAFSFDDAHRKLDARINNLLLAHESMLSDEALDIAEDKCQEAPADD